MRFLYSRPPAGVIMTIEITDHTTRMELASKIEREQGTYFVVDITPVVPCNVRLALTEEVQDLIVMQFEVP
jgi:hypothetical protein